jgi:hypothetical protein
VKSAHDFFLVSETKWIRDLKKIVGKKMIIVSVIIIVHFKNQNMSINTSQFSGKI